MPFASIPNPLASDRIDSKRSSRTWVALVGLLALSSVQHFSPSSSGATRSSILCEAYSLSSRTVPMRRTPWSMTTSPMDPASPMGVTPLSSPTSPASSSPAIPSCRAKNTALSISTTTNGSWTRGFPTLSEGRREEKAKKINYHWTKKNLAIALPALMGLLADPVLSMVDTGFVGRLGSTDLAALGVCTSIFHMAFTIFRGSTVATTSLIGNAKSKQEARQVAKISLTMAGILGTMVLLVLRLGGPQVLATMGVSKSSPLFAPACSYLFARSWAAPAVVGIVVAEGAFRGSGDSKTPLIAAGFAGLINLILDPLMMFPMKMGMMGAAAATAISQFAAAGVYGYRMFRRRMLPQKHDISTVSVKKVVKAILEANLAMLAKQGSMLVFYTYATALATRMGSAHVATHQVALTFFWLLTYWLDSGSVSGQVLMSQSMSDPPKARSLTKYMAKYALGQGLAVSAVVVGLGKLVAVGFSKDPAISSLLLQIMPHIAIQQTLISLCLVLEGLAIGGNQFRFMASSTVLATVLGMRQLSRATSVVGIWSGAVTTFFTARLINAVIGVLRVHWNLRNNTNQPSPIHVDDADVASRTFSFDDVDDNGETTPAMAH